MTMLDDDTLATLFARAAEVFEVPATGADDIVARARASTRNGVSRDSDESTPGDDTGSGQGGDRPDGLDRGHEADVGRRVTALAARHRVLSVAACLLVLLALGGAVSALVGSPSAPRGTSSLARPHVPSAAPSTTTTVPRFAAGAPAVPSPSLATPAPGFGSASSGLNAAHGAQGQAAGTNTGPSLPNDAVGQSAKIEQMGSLGLQVGRDALSKTMTELTNLAATFGGFVANSQTQSGAGTGGAPYGTITLQVPVQNFSAALKQAQTLGKTTSLSTKATDVTGQYVDLQSRISALQASRQQYLTIMSKATTVGDVLAVQAQLDTIQGQIEQLQGQLQVLTSETSYSTLNVTASEGSPPPRPVPLPESGLVRAWHDGIGGFVGDLEGLIRAAGPVLFTLLCLAALTLGGRALWRRYRRHSL
jgi:hypothetical protein